MLNHFDKTRCLTTFDLVGHHGLDDRLLLLFRGLAIGKSVPQDEVTFNSKEVRPIVLFIISCVGIAYILVK